MMKILWTVTLVAAVLFVIQSILTFIGADADADFDTDIDTGMDG
jgi:uncharacterized membrane protein